MSKTMWLRVTCGGNPSGIAIEQAGDEPSEFFVDWESVGMIRDLEGGVFHHVLLGVPWYPRWHAFRGIVARTWRLLNTPVWSLLRIRANRRASGIRTGDTVRITTGRYGEGIATGVHVGDGVALMTDWEQQKAGLLHDMEDRGVVE